MWCSLCSVDLQLTTSRRAQGPFLLRKRVHVQRVAASALTIGPQDFLTDRGSAAPSAVSRKELFQGFCSIFSPFEKSSEVAGSSSARVHTHSSSSTPAVQRPSAEVAYEVEYVECDGRWWALRTGRGWARSCGGLRGLSVGSGGDGCGGDHAAPLPAVLLVHVSGGASDSVQLQSARRSSCMQRWVRTAQNCAVHRRDLTGAGYGLRWSTFL